MTASLTHFLDKRLVFVTGKGGVGKTTVASALALGAARLGLKVLLTGIDSTEQIRSFFRIPEIPHRDTLEIEENLFVTELDRQKILDDFIRDTLKLSALYNVVLQSPIYQYFTAVAPGIRELMTLDRIASYERQTSRLRRVPTYDLIIVDSPATGHGLSFLDVPRNIIKMFGVGPFVSKARKIEDLLKDTSLTSILLVTLAEEMPANEAREMFVCLQENYSFDVGGLVVNNLYPPLFHSDEERQAVEPLLTAENPIAEVQAHLGDQFDSATVAELVKAATFQYKRRKLNDTYLDILHDGIDAPTIEIDFLTDSEDDVAFLERIVSHFRL